MIPLCLKEKIGLIPWSPLARGFLAGNRKPTTAGHGDTTRAKTDDFAHHLYYQDSDFAVVDTLTKLAQARGVPNAQLALGWLLHQPGLTAPIIGASKPGHLEDAVKALDIKLSPEELKLLTDPYRPHPVLGHS
jgi:aryl-alcohol dehydrogenase (NADP+)